MTENDLKARIPYIVFPDYVNVALSLLEEHGYRAYVVGGAVRDLLRGVPVNDYDITTNAPPAVTKHLFSQHPTFDTGIKHGTVSVVIDGKVLEITTFRADGTYTDSRHPDSVTFTTDLREDLARRDFTVNAMAIGLDGTLIDPFDGISDIVDSKIRTVGDAKKRFSEDALRIMRAYRFSAKMCYEIDEVTLEGTEKCATGLLNISRERIEVEWEKLICSQFCSKALIYMKKYGIMDVLFPRICHDADFLKKIETLPAKYTLRSAAFFKSERPGDLTRSTSMLCLKNSDSAEIKVILNALWRIRDRKEPDLRIFAYEYGELGCDAARIAELEGTLPLGSAERLYQILNNELPVRSRADLDVTGDDIIAAGIKDKRQISPIFSRIVAKVVRGQIKNKKNAILADLPNILKEIERDSDIDPRGWRKMDKYSIK